MLSCARPTDDAYGLPLGCKSCTHIHTNSDIHMNLNMNWNMSWDMSWDMSWNMS